MKPFILDNFTRGLWMVEAEDLLLPSTALLVAQNIEYFADGEGRVHIRGRRGKFRLNIDTSLPGPVWTIHRHSPRVGNPSTLVAYQDGASVNFQHDTDTNGILEPLAGDFDAETGKRWQFINNPTLDASYGVNGYNGLRKYTGTALSEVPLSGGIFAATGSDIGPSITVGQQRLWVTKRDSLNHLVYASDVDVDDVFGIPPISVNDPAGGTIVGLVPYRDAMLFAKTTGWWRFFGDPEFGFEVHPYSERGVIAPGTISLSPYGVFFLAQDGLYITDGSDPSGVNMSAALRPLFVSPAGQTLYPNALGKWMPRKEQYWLKLSASDDVLYVLQRVEGPEGPLWVWMIWRNMPCTALGCLDASMDTKNPYLGDSVGKWWEGDRGTVDDDNNTLTPLAIEIQSAFVPLDTILPYGRVVRMHAVFRSRQAILLRVFYDADPAIASQVSMGLAYPTVRLQSVDVPVTNQRIHGQWISVGAQLPQSNYEVELYRFAPDVAVRGPAIRRKGLGTQL